MIFNLSIKCIKFGSFYPLEPSLMKITAAEVLQVAHIFLFTIFGTYKSQLVIPCKIIDNNSGL